MIDYSNLNVGKNFKAGYNVIIGPDVVIGDNVTLGHNVILKSGTRIHNNVDIADNCCTTGACIIGNNVNIRTGATISKSVIIEDCAFIGPGIMTNHTKHVTHCRPKASSNFLVTRIGYGAVIGASCWLIAGVTIGSNVIVGGGTLIVKDIKVPGVYVGSPPRMLSQLTQEMFVPGKQKEQLNFTQEVIDKYLPGLSV
jgi:acetyltransferase-like isoleucine patch superfamily enzyme